MIFSAHGTWLVFGFGYGATLALSAWLTGAELWWSLGLAPPLIWLSVVDLDDHVIPDSASLLVAVLGLLNATFDNSPTLWATIGLAIAVLVLLAIAGEVFWRRYGYEALGLGDAKLIAAGTLVVGAANFWIMLLLAATGGIVAALLSKHGRKSGIPFGPFLAYSIFLTFLYLGDAP
jgi:leader peptidase (prepilin peptidase) / N-methyltransferase